MRKFLYIAVFLFISTLTTNAATLTVTKTADTNDGICNADCSLREAIDIATSGDTIEFSTLFNTIQFIALNGTELTINKSLTINGTGADKLTIDAGFVSRVINISGIGNIIAINGVKISSGFNSSPTDCNGGGISITDAIVNIDKSTIDFNFAASNSGNNCFGGGIYNAGTLNLTSSTISNNTATSNLAALGGGIHNGSFVANANATITNTTISGNTALTNGGAIQNGRTMLLTGVTITNNQTTNASGYSGINNGFISSTTIRSTIVSGNLNNRDVFGNFSSQGFNLIGDGSNATGLTQLTDQVGATATPIDAKLGTLANNGGTTLTHLMQLSSPGLDKGNNFGLISDQRGQNRTTDLSPTPNAVGGDGTDIGSFENLAPTVAGISISGRVFVGSGRGLGGVTVEMSNLSGNTISRRTNHFGYFSFTDVEAGQTYIFNAFSKHNQFAPQVLNPTENVTNLTFTANTQNSLVRGR